MAQYFQDAKYFSINELTVNQTTQTHTYAIEKLCENAAKGATFDSKERYPPPKRCPGTREDILGKIIAWFSRELDRRPILWLHGPTGMGKTTIAQAVAQESKLKDRVAATFFFSRSSPERSDSSKFVATIALQLALKIPELKSLIEQALQKDPTVFYKDSLVQLEKLIIEPCKSLQDFASGRWLIIVDGLDECHGPPGSDHEQEQELILKLLVPLVSSSFPVCVLLCSRAEEWLKSAFNEPRLWNISQREHLLPTGRLNGDIRHYLDTEFESISKDRRYASSMDHVQKPWPPMNIRHCLVEKACGQFIYIATVIKFIKSPWDSPPEQLNKLMDSLISRQDQGPRIFSDLDALYVNILKACPDKATMLRSVGEVMCVHITGGRGILALLDKMFERSPGSIHRGLRGVHSIVDVDNIDLTRKAIYHSSFEDFITSPASAGQFFIDIPQAHARFLRKCFDVLGLGRREDDLYKYAFGAWRSHHLPATCITEELVDCILAFDFRKWLIESCITTRGQPAHWFPRLSDWAWGHGLFQQRQLDEIPAESEVLRQKALQCQSHFRSSYDAAMVWFLDNDKFHQGGRLQRLFEACFFPATGDGDTDQNRLYVVTLVSPEYEYPLLAVQGEPLMVDLLDQDLVQPWSLYAASALMSPGDLVATIDQSQEEETSMFRRKRLRTEKVFDGAELACGVHFHIFPPPLLAFLADQSRSKHHCYVSQDRIQAVLRGMLEGPSGLSRVEDSARTLLKVRISSRALELPLSPWFRVLCLFIELVRDGSWGAGELLDVHGPRVLGVMDALGYRQMQKRFKQAAARHLPADRMLHHEQLR